MSDLQLKDSPQRKEKVGPADLAFVAFVVIITVIAVMLALIQIYLQNPRYFALAHDKEHSSNSSTDHSGGWSF